MDSDLDIILHITDSEIRIKNKVNGGDINKVISPQALIELLEFSKVKDPLRRIGRRPIGFIDGSIGEKPGHLKAIILVREGIYEVQYYKDKFQIPYPNMLFFFNVENNIIQNTKVLSVKNKDLKKTQVNSIKDYNVKDNAELFLYPFGNVSQYGSGVCWGKNHLPNIDYTHQLSGLPHLFIKSPMNDDNYKGVNNSNLTLRELLVKLNGRKRFDYKVLKPIVSTYKAYSDRFLSDM